MKRKEEEGEKGKKRERVELSERTLGMIFRLVSKRQFEEAKKLIPPESRHLPLYAKRPRVYRRSDDKYKYHLLHYAAMMGSREIIEYLLDGGANIELKEYLLEYTALARAVNNGNKECCELLLDRGANIETRDLCEKTPLMSASINGSDSMCRLLLGRGADVNACTTRNRTALHYVSRYNYKVSVAILLLKEGARFTRDDEGNTPLDLARESKVPEMRSLLENHIVTVNLSGVIARGLIKESGFSDFLVFGICDPRLFLIVSQFAFL